MGVAGLIVGGASFLEATTTSPTPTSVDIAKDHPDLALELAAGSLDRGEQAAWAVRHGMRTLVKRGDPRALALADGVDEPADEVIDYRVHCQGVRGVNAPKVFKLSRRCLEPGQPRSVTRRHRFEKVSIRMIRPGPHTIDVQVNGSVLGAVTVEVIAL